MDATPLFQGSLVYAYAALHRLRLIDNGGGGDCFFRALSAHPRVSHSHLELRGKTAQALNSKVVRAALANLGSAVDSAVTDVATAQRPHRGRATSALVEFIRAVGTPGTDVDEAAFPAAAKIIHDLCNGARLFILSLASPAQQHGDPGTASLRLLTYPTTTGLSILIYDEADQDTWPVPSDTDIFLYLHGPARRVVASTGHFYLLLPASVSETTPRPGSPAEQARILHGLPSLLPSPAATPARTVQHVRLQVPNAAAIAAQRIPSGQQQQPSLSSPLSSDASCSPSSSSSAESSEGIHVPPQQLAAIPVGTLATTTCSHPVVDPRHIDGDRLFYCQHLECEFVFETKSQLASHARTAHDAENMCEDCVHAFRL